MLHGVTERFGHWLAITEDHSIIEPPAADGERLGVARPEGLCAACCGPHRGPERHVEGCRRGNAVNLHAPKLA